MMPQGVLAAIFIMVVTFDRNLFATDMTCKLPANANLSCNFTSEGDTCGWKVVNNENVTGNWTFVKKNKPLKVEMNAKEVNTKARLKSDLTCATNNSSYVLRFDYSIDNFKSNDTCELKVFQDSCDTWRPLWWNQTSPDKLVSSGDIRIEDENKFMLIIQAKKLGNSTKCTIQLDNIVFERAAEPATAPTSTISTTSGTVSTTHPSLTPTVQPTETAKSTNTIKTSPTTPTITSPTTATTMSPTTDTSTLSTAALFANNDLPPEAFVGIVLGIVAIIAVAIAIFLLMRRKSDKESKYCPHLLLHFGKRKQQPHSPPRAVDNPAYVGEDDRIPVQTLPMKTSPEVHGTSDYYSVSDDALPLHGKRKDSQPDSTDYETAHRRESSHYYSKPCDDAHGDNPDLKSKVAGKVNGSVPAYELATAPRSNADDIDLKGLKNDQKKSSEAQNVGSHANTKDSNADSYNTLSFQQTSSADSSKKTEDTYNHLQVQDHDYKVPRSDAINEYTLAANPDRSSDLSAANAGQKQRYVNVGENGGPQTVNPLAHAATGAVSTSGVMQKGVNSDYNRLNAKDGHPVIGSGGGTGSGVYNHLDNARSQEGAQQSDEYSRVDFDRRTAADKTSGTDADTTYNHLDKRQDPQE